MVIPVELFSATEDHTIHFHQFQRGTADRIRYQRVNERTGEEVDYADIVKGKDIGGGDYVIVEPEELEAIAPGRSRTIDITTFIDLDEINPTTFVMRGREYLTAIRSDEGVLALETLFFADEIRNPADELDILPERASAPGKELDLAMGLIESMRGPWRPDDYHDTYRERVEQLIDDKHRGREVVTGTQPPEPTEISDLLKALQRSVSCARSGGRKPDRRSQKEPDLSKASKANLTGMARDLGVKGRSKMNRGELEKAVAEASVAALGPGG
ncbi:MAG: Ku protein [Pseudonocardiales bacterium]